VVLGILAELKPLINEAYDRFLEQQARAAKRRQQIRNASPAPPATLKAEREKQLRHQQESRQDRETDSRNGVKEEPWDLLKQMEGIKFVSGRPQVQEAPPVLRTRLEWTYPSIQRQ
jgi:hypothetical protein